MNKPTFKTFAKSIIAFIAATTILSGGRPQDVLSDLFDHAQTEHNARNALLQDIFNSERPLNNMQILAMMGIDQNILLNFQETEGREMLSISNTISNSLDPNQFDQRLVIDQFLMKFTSQTNEETVEIDLYNYTDEQLATIDLETWTIDSVSMTLNIEKYGYIDSEIMRNIDPNSDLQEPIMCAVVKSFGIEINEGVISSSSYLAEIRTVEEGISFRYMTNKEGEYHGYIVSEDSFDTVDTERLPFHIQAITVGIRNCMNHPIESEGVTNEIQNN